MKVYYSISALILFILVRLKDYYQVRRVQKSV